MKISIEKRPIFVSVIIPIFHDWDRLKICVDSLFEQDYPNERYEVIIVNNDPIEKEPELNLPDNYHLIKEKKPGSYSARNTGIRYSNNEVLVFTDADCIPKSNWLSELINKFEVEQERDLKNLLISGDVKIFSREYEPNWAESYDIIFGTNPKREFKNDTAPTANLLVHRTVFEEIGTFDSFRFSGGDSEFCKRASLHGYKLSFCNSAIVNHPARKSLYKIFIKARRKLASKIYEGIRFRNVIQILSPPLYRYTILVNSKEYRISIRIKAFVILHFVKLIEVIELIRLKIFKKKHVRE
ncbi:MAG: glycosyltransferase family 2 protein [Balneolaceae bacterium]